MALISEKGEQELMKKNNVKVKENITMVDKVNAINLIVSSYFTDGEYTPYYSDMAQVMAVITYFIEGIEFEEGEDIYNAVMQDEELVDIVHDVLFDDDMIFIKNNAKDKVEFIKQKIIHSHADMDKIIEACNVIIDSLENFSKLNIKEMKKEDMQNASIVLEKLASNNNLTPEVISNVLKDAVGFKMDEATEEILDSKNEQIRGLKEENKELRKYKALWESRNTTASSDKVVSMKV